MLNTAREGADEGRRQRGRRKEKKKEKERKRLGGFGQHLFSLAVLSPAFPTSPSHRVIPSDHTGASG